MIGNALRITILNRGIAVLAYFGFYEMGFGSLKKKIRGIRKCNGIDNPTILVQISQYETK